MGSIEGQVSAEQGFRAVVRFACSPADTVGSPGAHQATGVL